MKRLALAAAAIAALGSLASCSDDSSDEESAPETSQSTSESPTEATEEPTEATEEPTEAPDAGGDPERFTTAYAEVATLFTELNAQEDVQPTSTEEANAAAGLDETTPLLFADYSVLPDDGGGSFCLLSAGTGTYIAVTFAGPAGEVDLGDGECSYDTASALVVGDVATDTWTVGGELMGDLLPTGILGG